MTSSGNSGKRRRSSLAASSHVWPLGPVAELVAFASSSAPSVHVDVNYTPAGEPFLTLRNSGPGLSPPVIRALLSPSNPPPWQVAALRVAAELALLSVRDHRHVTISVFSRTRPARDTALHPAIILDWAQVTPDDPQFAELLLYSPWDNYHQVAAALRTIQPEGTLLALTSLSRNPIDATSELDLRTDHRDILCPASRPNTDFRKSAPMVANNRIRLTHSLRAYLELLFLRPTFRIFLRGAIVRPRLLHSCLLGRGDFSYAPRARSPEIDAPRPATIRLGFDPLAREDEFGIMIYCKGRLIRPYLKVGLQAAPVSEIRVVGVVEADFLTPTPNMQTFEKDKLYQGLMFSLDRYLKGFLALNGDAEKVRELCETGPEVRWVMCDDCGKWRIVQQGDTVDATDGIMVKWVCAMNLGGTTTCHASDDIGFKVLLKKKRMSPSNSQRLETSELKRQRADLDEGCAGAGASLLESPTFSGSPKAPSPPKRPRAANRATFAGDGIHEFSSHHPDSPPYQSNSDVLALQKQTRASSSYVAGQYRIPRGDSMPAQPRFDDAVWNTSHGISKPSPNRAPSPPSQGFMQDLNLEFGGPSPDLPPPSSVPFSGADLMLARSSAPMQLQVDSSPSQNLSAALASLIPQTKARPLPYPGNLEAVLHPASEKMNAFPGEMRLLGKSSAMPLTKHAQTDTDVRGDNETAQKKSPISGGMEAFARELSFEREVPMGARGEILKSSSSVSHEGASQKERLNDRSLNLTAAVNPRSHEMESSAEARLIRGPSSEAVTGKQRERPLQEVLTRKSSDNEGLESRIPPSADDSSANGATSNQKKVSQHPSMSPKNRNSSMKSPSPRLWKRRSPRNRAAIPTEPGNASIREPLSRGPPSRARTPTSITPRAVSKHGSLVIRESLRLSAYGDAEPSPGMPQRSPPMAQAAVKEATGSTKGSSRKPPAVQLVVSKHASTVIPNGHHAAHAQVLASPPQANDVAVPTAVGMGNRKDCDSRSVDLDDHAAEKKAPGQKQRESEVLVLATEAAASAAKAVLGSISESENRRNGEGIGKSALPTEIAWSHIALSAAVAAGAAAAAATTTAANRARSHILPALGKLPEEINSATNPPSVPQGLPVELSVEVRRAQLLKSKLQNLLYVLAPGAQAEKSSWIDTVDEFDVATVSKEILERVKQREKDEAERTVGQRLENFRVSQQIACESLQKVRRLVHVFLEQVVGVLRTDDEDEPVENQLEEYLRVLDVLPM